MAKVRMRPYGAKIQHIEEIAISACVQVSGRRLSPRADGLGVPASENLHIPGHTHFEAALEFFPAKRAEEE